MSRRAGGPAPRAAGAGGQRSGLPSRVADDAQPCGRLPSWPAHGAMLADDLTGAMDGGVQLLPRTAVEVLVSPGDGGSPATPADATERTLENASPELDAATHAPAGTEQATDAATMLVVNTQSRGLVPAAAAARVSAACHELRTRGRKVWFKKLDSTLRGNVGAELAALHEALSPCVIICTPALPAEGRTVQGGVLRVAGEPVMATPYRDEISTGPAASDSSAVIDIVRRQWPECRAALLSTPPQCGSLTAARHGMADLIVADAANDADLTALAAGGRCMAPAVGRLVWAGSAGLLRALTRCGRQPPSPPGLPQPSNESVPAGRGGNEQPLVVISGSRRAMAQRQMDVAAAASAALVLRMRASPGADVQEPSWQIADTAEHGNTSNTDAARAREMAVSALDRGQDLFLCVAGSALDAATRHQPAQRSAVAAALAALVGSVLAAATRPRALLMVGGDTAYACLSRLGVRRLALAGEAEPYIPWARISSGPWEGLEVIAKAGGFGDPQTLQRICTQTPLRNGLRISTRQRDSGLEIA